MIEHRTEQVDASQVALADVLKIDTACGGVGVRSPVTELSGEGGTEDERVGGVDLMGDRRAGVAEEVGSEAESPAGGVMR
ncbi:hypothetical protein M2114_000696 [Aurantimicrobium minutum]|nr:hypothetical protein [Aurantimicrobium minutum]